MNRPNGENAPSLKRQKYFVWFSFFLLYLLLEVLCWAALFGLDELKNISYSPRNRLSGYDRKTIHTLLARNDTYLVIDDTLGWKIRPNAQSKLYRSNSQGLRADQDYTSEPAPEKIRIAAFGDSFTHSSDVPNEYMWATKLQAQDPKLEVLNFGVGGYGLDQAFLRYEAEGPRYRPHIVLIGFMSENICRVVNVFRPFYTSAIDVPLTKPRFEIKKGELALVPNPLHGLSDYQKLLDNEPQALKELGKNDYYYSFGYDAVPFDFLPSVRLWSVLKFNFSEKLRNKKTLKSQFYATNSEAREITFRLFDKFYASAVENGSQPVIVIFPTRDDILSRGQNGGLSYAVLENYLKSKKYEFVDLIGGFKDFQDGRPIDDFFSAKRKGGHYSAQGNEIVAKTIYRFLKEKNFYKSPL